MAQPLPYMQFYFADYDADTPHLSTLEHGAYFLLIKAYWKGKRALPDNDRRLAIVAGLSLAEWQEIRPELASFFTIADGLWRHKRIEEELQRVSDRTEQARSAGRTGAQRRWNSAGAKAGGGSADRPSAGHGDRLGGGDGEAVAIPDSDSDSNPESDSRKEGEDSSFAALVSAWNALAKARGLPAVRTLTEARRRSARARLREHGEADVLRAIALIAERPFLLGGGRRGWKADLDWLLGPASIPRILEGQRYLGCGDEDERPSGWRR